MIGLIQRVTQARVLVDDRPIATIDAGLAVLIGIEKQDAPAQITALLAKLLAYRVFADAHGRMNLSLADTQGELLLVPQFTLAADTRKGLRPGFAGAAPPELAKPLFLQLVEQARREYGKVQSGRFGAHMQVQLSNDGPVTFWLQVAPQPT